MQKHIFITGTSTDVGKSIASAIVCQSLGADYWKPIQSGANTDSDRQTVQQLCSHPNIVFHPESYNLQAPLSPHIAAQMEGVSIDLAQVQRPQSHNQHMVIEGAGGLLVPLNGSHFVSDLIDEKDAIIIVSKHYLGSINHTLLTLLGLRQMGFKHIGVLFNGEANPETEATIAQHAYVIGRIDPMPEINPENIAYQAQQLYGSLLQFVSHPYF
jgi:dethiobiotin synthetase